MKSWSPLLLLMSSLPLAAAENDFSALVHHWNFDEGREWHRMAFPYHSDAKVAHDSVGSLDLKIPGKDKDAVWASGRQYSGVRLNVGGLAVSGGIEAMKESFTLSFWLKSGKTQGVVIGDKKQLALGVVDADGHLGVVLNDKTCMKSPDRVTDEKWHHFVITRNAGSGNMRLFVDGKLAGIFTGPAGELESAFTKFGVAPKKKKFDAVLDQVHIFNKEIQEDTVQSLYDNHAPKIYDQEHLVDHKMTTRTGSILHLYAHDNEMDKLSVARHSQGKYGTVENVGDGTFDYTPGKKFKGIDSFEVDVTDGRGGFCRAEIRVRDYRYIEGPLVDTFTYTCNLPDLPETEASSKHRKPMRIKLPRRKLPDLLVEGNSRIWYYANQSSKGKIRFAVPVEVKDGSGKPLPVEGAAMLREDTMVLRQKDGTLQLGKLKKSGSALSITPGSVLKNTKGDAFKLNARFFVFVDYNLDGKKDLIHGGGNGMTCFLNKGNNQVPVFAEESLVVHEESYSIYPGLGDLDGDGRLDLLHGNNWGRLHMWSANAEGENMKHQRKHQSLVLKDAPQENFLRQLNGTNLLADDLDGDEVPDLVIGGSIGNLVAIGRGVDPNSRRNNLKKIEKEIYKDAESNLASMLMANDQALLKRYKTLMNEWIAWATKQNTPAAREAAYNMLKKHIAKYPFLQRQYLKDAWVKKDNKTGEILEYGTMHHVPGMFTQNWITLHKLMPDSEEHRKDVADALGMKGLDREQYLTTGLPLADNNHCSEGQLLSIRDFMLRHPRILFPDDHLSIDQHFGDGRDAMCYIFRSNKNTFGSETGNSVNEMARDMVQATEECLEGPGAANGDYFTLVMAHEVCHSLDGYVHNLPNQDLKRRWGDVIVYAGNNGGAADLVATGKTGWFDAGQTQEKFKAAGLWDGTGKWNEVWDEYWAKKCPYTVQAFMRGNTGWFIYAPQETLATQANHHWPRSESRLIGAILRYKMGYKSPINEVVHYLDVLSAGMNKIHMYHTRTSPQTKKVEYISDPAWLVRNDKGYITELTMAGRTYSFEVDENGRTIGIKANPFDKKLDELAKKLKPKK